MLLHAAVATHVRARRSAVPGSARAGAPTQARASRDDYWPLALVVTVVDSSVATVAGVERLTVVVVRLIGARRATRRDEPTVFVAFFSTTTVVATGAGGGVA